MTTNPMTRRNHPRVRGEESLGKWNRKEDHGITPACAGKSAWPIGCTPGFRNHPRVRGEEHFACISMPCPCGITPACAGKRMAHRRMRAISRNHPRVRGEERMELRQTPFIRESPPRARGRGSSGPLDRVHHGITPACAGKRVMKMRPSRVWTYPLSANFSFFFGTSFECRAIPERGVRRLFGCQASGLATCYASRIQEQTIGCFTGVHCLYPTSRSLRNGTEYNRAES